MPDTLELGPLTLKNFGILKTIVNKTFPVDYPPEAFELISQGNSQIGWFGDFAISVVSARHVPLTELHPPGTRVINVKDEAISDTEIMMYVMVLSVLRPYRRKGFATQLLSWVLSKAKADGLKHLALHTQETNVNAIKFYQKHGFEIVARVESYYPDLPEHESHAVLMLKKL